MIYVSFNYRVNVFGWLGGTEALAGGAANVGLYDREYHRENQESSRVPTLNCVILNADGSGVRQKSSS